MKFRVFVFLFFIIAVISFSQELPQGGDDWYHGKPIRDIVFSGLVNISQSELDGLLNPYKGRSFEDNIFWEITGKLYALEYFDKIDASTHRGNPAGTEVILRFTVVERPVIGRINFIGNSGVRRNELNDLLTSKEKAVYNQAKVRVDIQAIINKYIEKGYPNISVTANEIKAGDGNITLNFIINEGAKISISKIEFQGNTRFSANTLRSQLSLKARSLLNDGAFQEAKLLADRESIAKYYHDRGYIDAVVRDVTRTADSDEKGTNLLLTFMIEEGNEFKFDGITFEGNVIFTTEQLDKLVFSKTGETVNMTRLEMDMQRVYDLYFENGYTFNLINRIQHKDNENMLLSYTIRIVERGRAYIENIIILGNEKTKTKVILREIPLEPGDVFSKTKVMDAMRNLYNLQFFSTIMPDTLQGSTENLMDLVFTFEEQPTTDIQFGLTFSGSADPDTFPISGMLKWNDRNFLGTGNQLGVEVNSSIVDSATFSVNYMHRWIFGLPLSLGIDFSANYITRLATMNNQPPFFHGDEPYAVPDGFGGSYQEYISRDKTPTREYMMEYDQWYLSLGLSTGYRWQTFMGIVGVSGGIRFGIIRNSYDSGLFRPFDPSLREGNNEWMPKNSFWFSASLDQRDIFYDPSNGYFFYQRLSFYGIFNAEREHFIRSDTKAQYYLTLFNMRVTDNWNFKGILALHLGLSAILPHPRNPYSSKKVPEMEDANKLAIDGMFIGRGWSGEYKNKGLLLIDSWVEMRFPLVPGILAFDLFFDMAATEAREGWYFKKINDEGNNNFGADRLRFSLGAGLRFTLPQFPLRLSLVKRFKIVDDKVEWQKGAIFANDDNPSSGIDLVLSFVVSY
ncbi:MAG: outer membrane protein assembly factor BamA [Treponema sp.]|nr:outer membrane protein assembly factor BamA [Treponema sp.]